MMKLLWLCCGVLLSTTIHGAIYKRVEADGSVTYTDTPGHNTQAVDVNTLTTNTTNVIPSTKITPKPTSQRSAPSLNKPAAQSVKNYQITFLTPAHRSTIRSNKGLLKVVARVSPQRAGQFELLIDGKVRARQPTPDFALDNVPRGEHTIQLNLKDKTGKLIASSKSITVYLHRASVLNRAN